MNGRIICGDSRQVAMPPADLVVTSPPYNVGIDYADHEDTLNPELWQLLVGRVLSSSWEALTVGGRMCVNVHHESGRNPGYPLGMKTQQILENLPGSMNRGTIIWDKGASAGQKTSWGSWKSPSNPVLRGEYEVIYVYSRGRMDHTPKRLPAEPDISRDEFLAGTRDVWRELGGERMTENHANHPAPFPVGLARRLIQLYSWPGDTVLDPFFGSGTVGLAAEGTGRRWVGVELSEEYCKAASRRIGLFDGMGVPVEYVD